MPSTKKATEGDEFHRTVPRAAEDDVEGHKWTQKATEGDEFHRTVPRAAEDDVEGHNIGVMNPMLARDLARARERDIQRETSRNSLISEAKRALRKR